MRFPVRLGLEFRADFRRTRVSKTFRIFATLVIASLPVAGAYAADKAAANQQTSSGTIIWDAKSEPAAASAGPNGTIIWNDSPAAKTRAPASAFAGNAASDKNGIIWDEPARPGSSKPTAQAQRPAPTAANDSAGPCREFQTHIMIDGKSEPAHGTACRQPPARRHMARRQSLTVRLPARVFAARCE